MDTFGSPTTNSTSSVLSKVFGWMFAGLAISGLVAYGTTTSPAVLNVVLGNRGVFFGLIILELVLVASLSWLIRRISAATAMGLFIIYAVVNGLTLSTIVLAYTDASLASTFAIAAGMFGAMALYGYITKRDLSRWGSILLMGLIGLILAGIVNIFINNNGLNLAVSIIGIIIFTGLTAYDIQKIKNFGALETDSESRSKQAIFGALMLYLDFINIFLSLLNITGKRRD